MAVEPHPLLPMLVRAAAGAFPPVDGGAELVGPLDGGLAGLRRRLARSLRAFLREGFVPLGSEVVIVPATGRRPPS